MRRIRAAALAGLSAILLPLALPNELLPWGSPPVGLLCLAPFLAAVSLAPSFRSAALLGALFGAISTLLSSFWLVYFQEYAVWTLGGVVLACTGFCALLGAVLHGLSRVAARRYRPFILASAWVLYEYLKSTGFLGYPWGLVAYPVHALLPLVQVADIGGVWAVSLLMALANAVIAEAMIRAAEPPPLPPSPRAEAPGELLRQAGAVASLAAAALLYGVVLLRTEPASRGPTRPFTLALMQQNTNPWMPYDEEGILANQGLGTEAVEEARRAGKRIDLLVWSETSLPYDPASHSATYARYPRSSPLLPYLHRTGVPLLSGSTIDVDPASRQWMNGAVLLRPDGRVAASYGKQHPVPFAEAIPFWEAPVVQEFFSSVVGIQLPWVMGGESVVFEVRTGEGTVVRFGAPICFEDAFSDLCRRFVLRGADLLVNLTNDSWSQRVSSLTQHFVVARFRAVENRRTLARSTNGGITAIVDPTGRVTAILPHFRPGYLLATVDLPAQQSLSPYTRFGDWLPLLLAGLLVAVAAAAAVAGRRARGQATP